MKKSFMLLAISFLGYSQIVSSPAFGQAQMVNKRCDREGYCYFEIINPTCMYNRNCQRSNGFKYIGRKGDIVQVVARYEDGDNMLGLNCMTRKWLYNYDRYRYSSSAIVDTSSQTEMRAVSYLCSK